MSELILAPAIGQSPQIAVSPDAERLKLDLLDNAGRFTAITSIEVRDQAVVCAGSIKAHITQVEKDRVAIKEPFLSTGRAIDKAAKDHSDKLQTELTRLNRALGAYEEARQAAAAAAAQKILDDEREILRKQQEAATEAVRVAEDLQKKEEAAAAKGKELSPAQKAKALEAQLEAEELREKLENDRKILDQSRMVAAQQAQEAKPTGGAFKKQPVIVVTDIHALYAHNRQFVRLEPDLLNIKFAINSNPGVQIPGVSYTMEASFNTKAR